MLQRFIALPAEMARDHKRRLRVFPQEFLYSSLPFREIGVGNITQPMVFHAFHQAAAVQDFLCWEPDNDIVAGMPSAGIICFKPLAVDFKHGVALKVKLSLLFMMLPAEIVCEPGGVGSDPFLPEIFEAGRPVVMVMGGYAERNRLTVPGGNTIQQRLELHSIPRRIEQNHTLLRDQVHAVRGEHIPAEVSISGIYIEISGKAGDEQTRIPSLSGRPTGEKKGRQDTDPCCDFTFHRLEKAKQLHRQRQK